MMPLATDKRGHQQASLLKCGGILADARPPPRSFVWHPPDDKIRSSTSAGPDQAQSTSQGHRPGLAMTETAEKPPSPATTDRRSPPH
ncbi:hypothetical protein KIL84_008463 [Mauremys mutica]|uniref:Uncharacterized protein n=1 Tax=Mauremys mutica TaxID=74926 RepID=A0A9D3X229_9SAUR|nr:hypothetical protein KIL84_008463 [Mauremys mutica]